MIFSRVLLGFAGAALALALHATPASAQASRTWVSGVGDDANPCSRTAPCKTFAGAISKTAAGGEISVLDPGGFGGVTITKSISIVADGSEGSILAAATNGIVINAGVNDIVNIRGILLEGAGSGLNGIRFLAGRELHIQHCLIRGFQAGTGFGIDIQPGGTSWITIADVTINKNTGGINVRTTGAANALVFLERVHVTRSLNFGVRADGANSNVWINDSSVTFNGVGLNTINSGKINSYGDNVIIGSSSPFSAVLPLQ